MVGVEFSEKAHDIVRFDVAEATQPRKPGH